MAVKEYCVLAGLRNQLEPLVNEAMRLGWEPLGGVALVRQPIYDNVHGSVDMMLAQGMVRELQVSGSDGGEE